MTPADDQIAAIRSSAALSRMDHVVCLRVSGDDAFDALDHLCSGDLHLHVGQMLQTLLLDEDARPKADVYVCMDDEDFYVLSEGPTAAELMDHMTGHMPGGARVAIQDLGATHGLLSVNGPFAWELLAEALGPEIVGLPYMTFFKTDEWTCFRAGKTGEFGYDLLIPAEKVEETRTRLLEVGEAYELGSAGVEALDQCALENWFFNIRREGRADATPIELQLQWRVSYKKEYVGSAALSEQRRRGPASRITTVVARHAFHEGDQVRFEERAVGTVVNAGFSAVRNDWVGLAMIEVGLAYPGLDCFSVDSGEAAVPVRTVSPPLIDNLSIHVNPQVHSFGARDRIELPPLAGGSG